MCYSLAVGTFIVQIIAKKAVPLGPFAMISDKSGLESNSDNNQLLQAFSGAKDRLRQSSQKFTKSHKAPLLDGEESDGADMPTGINDEEGSDGEAMPDFHANRGDDPDGLGYSMHLSRA